MFEKIRAAHYDPTHNFAFLGKKTRAIKPGGKAHLFTAAITRGTFVYRSTLDTSKAFRGSITVA